MLSVWLVPSTPMKELRLTTSGSFRTASASWFCRFAMASIGDALRGLGDGLDHAGVLHREESLRDQDIEQHGKRERQRWRPARSPAGGPAPNSARGRSAAMIALKTRSALRSKLDALSIRAMADQLGAHHRHQRQRDHGGDDDGDRERDGEFVEQPADDVAHEQQRVSARRSARWSAK